MVDPLRQLIWHTVPARLEVLSPTVAAPVSRRRLAGGLALGYRDSGGGLSGRDPHRRRERARSGGGLRRPVLPGRPVHADRTLCRGVSGPAGGHLDRRRRQSRHIRYPTPGRGVPLGDGGLDRRPRPVSAGQFFGVPFVLGLVIVPKTLTGADLNRIVFAGLGGAAVVSAILAARRAAAEADVEDPPHNRADPSGGPGPSATVTRHAPPPPPRLTGSPPPPRPTSRPEPRRDSPHERHPLGRAPCFGRRSRVRISGPDRRTRGRRQLWFGGRYLSRHLHRWRHGRGGGGDRSLSARRRSRAGQWRHADPTRQTSPLVGWRSEPWHHRRHLHRPRADSAYDYARHLSRSR